MLRSFRTRYRVILLIVCVLFTVLIVRLLDLQWRNGEEYAAQAISGLDKELRLTGNRGMIMDRNGMPLAYDQNSYNVVFYKDPGKSLNSYGAEYTEIIRRTIQIVENENGEFLDTFNILVDDSGEQLNTILLPG